MTALGSRPASFGDGPPDDRPNSDIGGKARGLERIAAAGLRTAPWFVVRATERPADPAVVPEWLAHAVAEGCQRLTRRGADGFAVRSSALDEDGVAHSFAGQYVTVLGVLDVPGVMDAIGRCWASDDQPAVRSYRAAVGLPPDPPGMAVIVQAMVNARVSGVAFSEVPDCPHGPPPVDGPGEALDEAVVVATRGLGAALVSGEVNGDEYRVRGDGTVVVRRVDPGAPPADPLEPAARGRCLTDDEVRAVAAAARTLARSEGVPQDIEWAITWAGELYVLQTRPVTAGPTISRGSDRGGRGQNRDRVRLWDNANIVESFSGVTLPLTYSVAREAYASVYRGACRAMGVSEAALVANADLFEQMIGHIDGRVYYNVSSWHRVLALLPGFGANQPLLERMMGAARPGGRAGERAESVDAARPDLLGLTRFAWRSGAGLVLFERHARDFERLIGRLTRESREQDVESMSIDELLEAFDQVRTQALARWHVTIFNDLAVMVVHGALRVAAERWLDADAGPIVNRLLRTDALASTAPAVALRRMAARLRSEPAWRDRLDNSDDPLGELRSEPSLAELSQLFDGYLARWGDRCPSELQLDRPSFKEDPEPILSVIRALAAVPEVPTTESPQLARATAWADLRSASLSGSGPVREARLRVLRSLIEMTRYRLRWRERMRFARTEVFAIGRRIFRAMDRQFVSTGLLERPGDLHYLDVDEIRGAIRGTIPATDLRVIVDDRRTRFAQFAADPMPPPRLETAGPVALARRVARASGAEGGATVSELVGTPVCGGVVRGPCLPIEDPRSVASRPGEIIVARSTDPGWIPTLLAATGLLVERGSLLSHSAIVARELGLPTIVGIDGLMATVEEGQIVEMDGSSGIVRFQPAVSGRTRASERSP